MCPCVAETGQDFSVWRPNQFSLGSSEAEPGFSPGQCERTTERAEAFSKHQDPGPLASHPGLLGKGAVRREKVAGGTELPPSGGDLDVEESTLHRGKLKLLEDAVVPRTQKAEEGRG